MNESLRKKKHTEVVKTVKKKETEDESFLGLGE